MMLTSPTLYACQLLCIMRYAWQIFCIAFFLINCYTLQNIYNRITYSVASYTFNNTNISTFPLSIPIIFLCVHNFVYSRSIHN